MTTLLYVSISYLSRHLVPQLGCISLTFNQEYLT
jgi:hypothetical protein